MNNDGKLVRDGIPELIRQSGREPEVRHLVGDDLVAALAKKLVEEAHEAAEAIGKRGDLVEELADVREVMSALMATCGIRDQEVADAVAAKARERGAFALGAWLAGVRPSSGTSSGDMSEHVVGNLTEKQKDELLSAFRNTFDAQRHGEAVKAMYADFATHFAVHPDELRAVVNEDLRINQEFYAGLRQKLLARQRVKKLTANRQPAALQNSAAQRATSRKRTVTCPVCAQVVPGGKNRGPKDHDYGGRPCSGELATCRVCKQKLPVRASDGRISPHSAGGTDCKGSGRSPYEGRSPKFMQGITRVVSGGLSSSRRRH